MNKKQVVMLLTLLVALLVAGPAAAQDEVIAQILGPQQAATGDTELSVGDPIELTLQVTHPADVHVVLPQLEASWGDFVLRSQSPATTTDNPDGSQTTSQVIDARLFAPGSFTTPPLTITVADDAGQLSDVIAPPATVTIGSVLVEGDTELRDIKPQAELPLSVIWPWLAAGSLIAISAGGAILWWRRHQARLALAAVDTRLPHEVALDELARIGALQLAQEGRFKEHYTLVSNCIRLYVDRRYGVPILERTTAEFQSLLRHVEMSSDQRRQLILLLDESDLVKFSKYTPDAESANQLLLHGRLFVEATRPVAVAEGAAGGEPPTKETITPADRSTKRGDRVRQQQAEVPA